MAGEAFMNRLTADPAIRLLLMSYDLIAVDRRLHAEEALDSVRGHLHDHGVDVELSEVVGGAVYVKLHGIERSDVAIDGVRHDLEEALKAGLVGFQELVIGDRSGARKPELLQVGGLRRAQRPVYRRVCGATDLATGTVMAVDVDGHGILIVTSHGDSSRLNHAERARSHCSSVRCTARAAVQLARVPIRRAHRPAPRRPGAAHGLPVAVEGNDVRAAVGTEPARAKRTVRTLVAGFGNVLRGTTGSASRSSVACAKASSARCRPGESARPESGSPRSSHSLRSPIIVDAMTRGGCPAASTD